MFSTFSLLAPLMLGVADAPLATTAHALEQDGPRGRARDERRRMRGDADWAFRARRSGQMMSLGEIEQRVIPRMEARGHRYIGSTFDRDSTTYTLKFMRDESVVWIDVDGRTGRIIGR